MFNVLCPITDNFLFAKNRDSSGRVGLVWPYDFEFCFLGLGFYENFLHSIAPPFFEEDNRQYFEFICTFYSV